MSVGGLDNGALSTFCKALAMFTLGGDGGLYSGDGHSDESFRDTVDSLPSVCRMCVYARFTLVNSTSSTSGSFLLFRTNRLSITHVE